MCCQSFDVTNDVAMKNLIESFTHVQAYLLDKFLLFKEGLKNSTLSR